MRNKPNLGQSQMFITVVSTTNYNEKWAMDTWLKQTQFKPNFPNTKLTITVVMTMTNNNEQ